MPPPLLSVSELNDQVRRSLEQAFPLLWVSGEISNLVRAASGHVYFSIKDASAQVRCVMFRNRVQLAGWQLANGQQVEVNARVTLYEARGDFQLTVDLIRRAGLGRLYEAYERLRQQLAGQGLFAPERKRPLPAYPRCIGIITSAQAAALHDVLVTLRRRASHVPVIIFPTLVQGADASAGIVKALTAANQLARCDLLLLVRGGGSIEDLWPFNEELTARAIAASAIPVITGIGHETDVTIADLVADQRGTTPTAAAELATAHWFSASQTLLSARHRLNQACARRMAQARQRLDLAAARLEHPAARIERHRRQIAHLTARLHAGTRHWMLTRSLHLARLSQRFNRHRPATDYQAQRIGHLEQRLHSAMQALAHARRQQLHSLEKNLHLLAPAHTLARGYAIVRSPTGHVARHPDDLPAGQTFAIELAQGHLEATPVQSMPASLPASLPVAGSDKPD